MKLPIIEALKTSRTGKLIPVNNYVSVIHKVEAPSSPFTHRDAFEVKTEALFNVVQIVDDERALDHCHKRAVHMMTETVYGPVVDRLHEIKRLLWENGPLYDDKITKAVESLIDDLRP